MPFGTASAGRCVVAELCGSLGADTKVTAINRCEDSVIGRNPYLDPHTHYGALEGRPRDKLKDQNTCVLKRGKKYRKSKGNTSSKYVTDKPVWGSRDFFEDHISKTVITTTTRRLVMKTAHANVIRYLTWF